MPDKDNPAEVKSGTRAILAALCTGNPDETETSVQELESLLETAGGTVAAVVIQNAEKPNIKTYIGT